MNILIYTLKGLLESYISFQIATRMCTRYVLIIIEESHSLLLIEELSLAKTYNPIQFNILHLLQITVALIDKVMVIIHSTIYNSNAPTTINNNSMHSVSQINLNSTVEGLMIKLEIV